MISLMTKHGEDDMLKSLVVPALATVLLIAAPTRAEDVHAAIEAANAKMMADYAASDTKSIAAAYTEDGVMLPPDATRIDGRAAIEDSGRAGSMPA
jgi:hypothetical protein